jgi:hypothetical protein
MCIYEKAARMIKFDLDINIYRPLAVVFSFVVKPENDFHWQYGTLMSAQVSKGEMGVGALFRSIGHFMGRRIESVHEVTNFESNKKYGFESKSGSMHSATLYTFGVVNYSTRIHASTQIELGREWKASDAATAKTVKKEYRENLSLLKGILEAGPTEKPSDDLGLVSGPR